VRELTSDEQVLAYRFAHLALPADASGCDPWVCHGHGDWRRYFVTQEWDVGATFVSVGGEQNHHGEIRRWLHVVGEDHLDKADRLRLTEAMENGRRLLDGLNAQDGEPGRFPAS